MNPIDDDLLFASSSSSSSSSSSFKDEKVEPQDLLEECWFFGNLLDKKSATRKKTMLRCHSDPCSSSTSPSSSPPSAKMVTSGGLVRAPSLPSSMEKVKEKGEVRGRSSRSKKGLMRAPSMPPCIGNELVEDAEIDFTLSRLIRQASLNSNDVLPPKHASSKGTKQSSTTARKQTLRRNSELESIDTRSTSNQNTVMKKSSRESAEAPRFSDTYLTREKKDLKLSVETTDRHKVRRPYDLPESWLVQSSAPPVPKWVDNRSSSAEDMKAQIKFWARAVAANTR